MLSSKKNWLFDLDGTLIDSSPSHEKAFLETLTPHYPELAATFDYHAIKGQATPRVIREMGITDPAIIETLSANKQRLYRESVSLGHVKLFEGVKELLERLVSQGKELHIMTGSSKTSAEAILAKTGIRSFFKTVVAADEIGKSKPDPDFYLYALTRFQLEAAETVVIEDAFSGYESARGAGLDVVLVNAGFKPGDALCFETIRDFLTHLETPLHG